MATEIITSTQNPKIKRVKKLLTRNKYRREDGLAVAEGVHLVQGLLESEIVPQLFICAQSSVNRLEIVELVERLDALNIELLTISDDLFASMSDLQPAVGVLVVFKPPMTEPSNRLLPNTLLLEGIQDPGNLGTILRTAVAAGVQTVYLSSGSASAWSPKVLRAGMGAQFSLEIYEDADIAQLIKNSDLPILATDLSAEKSIYDVSMSEDNLWLFGNEGQGVSEKLLELCTERVTIPQASTTVESLNVSAAVAVCLFEQRRQCIGR